jgi:hypothetical protein
MKTAMQSISLGLILACTSITTFTSCKKDKKEDVAPAPIPAPTSAAAKTSAAIDARVGTFIIVGVIDTAIYTKADGKKVTITKMGDTKIRISAVNFSMGTYEIEVKNGTTVTDGVVSGSDDGKAIGYVGNSASGKIVFACLEDNALALIVEGSGNNSVQIGGEKQ